MSQDSVSGITEQSAEMLGCALEGSAQRFYARLPTRDRYDFQWLVLVLHKRYNSHVPETQREKLLSRTRAPGESQGRSDRGGGVCGGGGGGIPPTFLGQSVYFTR